MPKMVPKLKLFIPNFRDPKDVEMLKDQLMNSRFSRIPRVNWK
jgi:hypothetical protein